MIDPIMKTREEVLEELKYVNQQLAEIDPVTSPNTHYDLVKKKAVLRWVLGMD